MSAGLNPAQVLQCDRHAHRAMPTHSKIAHVIEENNARHAVRLFVVE